MTNISEIAKNREDFWKTTDYTLNGGDDGCSGRRDWFVKIVALYRPKSVLEIGCNEGANLRRIHALHPDIQLAGIEINPAAAAHAERSVPKARIVCGNLHESDKFFKEKEFDLVFSMGVAIHIPPEMMGTAKKQCLRLAKRVILHCEEHSENPEPKRWYDGVPHRWSHDYVKLYQEYPVALYRTIVGSADGAHQLVIVNLTDTPYGLQSLIDQVRLWYLCRILPFIDMWSKRLFLRWRLRGPIHFFLPGVLWHGSRA